MAPAIVLNPTHGPVGTSVLITGSGFALTSAITFKYGGVTIVASDGPITSDGTGAFTAHITVPASVEGVNAVEADDASAGSATANFTVDSKIVIAPALGPVGTSILVTGTGFATESAISFTFGDVAITPQEGDIVSDVNGSFSCHIVAPDSAIETVAIVATDASSNTSSANFAVNGVNVLTLTTVTDFVNFLKPYKYSATPFDAEVNNDSYEDMCAIDCRGCSELDVQIANEGNTNGLTYQLYGMLKEVTTPIAYDATKYSPIGSPANVAASSSVYVAVTDPFSWVLVRVKRQTSGQDTEVAVYARQRA